MLNQTHFAIVKRILLTHLNPTAYHLFLFGSWAAGTNRKYSDLDIGIEGVKPVSLRTIALIKDAFEESNLPYTVDVVDFAKVSEQFKEIAKKDIIELN